MEDAERRRELRLVGTLVDGRCGKFAGAFEVRELARDLIARVQRGRQVVRGARAQGGGREPEDGLVQRQGAFEVRDGAGRDMAVEDDAPEARGDQWPLLGVA